MFKFGKKVLALSFILLFGLLIIHTALSKYFPDHTAEATLLKADLNLYQTKVDSVYFNIRKQNDRSMLLSELPEIILDSGLKNGKPIALLACSKLYFIDKNGFLVSPSHLIAQYDFPVISCDSIQINPKELRIANTSIIETLELLNITRQNNFIVYSQISSAVIDKDIGLIFNLNGPPEVNAIFGRGKLKQKLAYLLTIMESMGTSQLIDNASYLDFRYDDQVIVKKKV